MWSSFGNSSTYWRSFRHSFPKKLIYPSNTNGEGWLFAALLAAWAYWWTAQDNPEILEAGEQSNREAFTRQYHLKQQDIHATGPDPKKETAQEREACGGRENFLFEVIMYIIMAKIHRTHWLSFYLMPNTAFYITNYFQSCSHNASCVVFIPIAQKWEVGKRTGSGLRSKQRSSGGR